MSTASLFLHPDDIAEHIQAMQQADHQLLYRNGSHALGLSAYITFYVYHTFDEHLGLSKKIIQLYDDFQALIGDKFQKVWKHETQVWLNPGDKRLPDDLYDVAIKMDKKERKFWMRATDKDAPDNSPLWSFSSMTSDYCQNEFTTVKLCFSPYWYAENQDQWHDFIAHCFNVLQPEQCYSGYEIGNGNLGIMSSYEAETLERICADYFYGLDIDHPAAMAFHDYDDENGYVNRSVIGAGIRTPTWSFMLSPYWLNKLGKTEAEVRAELDDPRITITAFPHPKERHNSEGHNALWIQLGELALYPVGEGKPDVLVKANRLIQPIRCDQLKLSSLDTWEDDPNPRFDYHSGINWMQRFDDDMDWLRHRSPSSPLPPGVFEAKPGQTVPKAGYWYAPALGDKTEPRYFEAGQQLPFDKANEDGDEVTWYRQLDGNVGD